jgi:NADPH-dependent 2,4-dienoyl-CoA reductase/sulfur reductase-like enzyme
LFDGERVRCPWHHACFSLRTGEAVDAPALNPVDCWKVERQGANIVVREKLVRLAPVPLQTSGLPSSVVIVGAGAAGNAAAEMLRREGYGGPVTMLGRDESVPYDRPNLSKDYLAGNAPEEWIPLRPPEFYSEHGITLERSTRVTAIDAKAKRVTLANGRSIEYGALLLATGADASRLPIPGADLPHVHTLRTLADSRAIIAAARKGARAVVVGASFNGLEVAASLRAREVDVDVVAPESVPLHRVMGEAIGTFVKRVHEEHGVKFHLNEAPTAIDAKTVTLKSGAKLSADLVVLGVGVRPSIELAEAAGCKTDRGVVVDEHLATSVPGIWAAGDIARWPDPWTRSAIRVEHWVVAERQGQSAAKNMLGKREPFTMVPFFWSNHYDVVINYVGHAEKWDRIDVSGDLVALDAAVAFRAGGKTLAVATIGRDHACLEAEYAIAQRDESALSRIVPAV